MTHSPGKLKSKHLDMVLKTVTCKNDHMFKDLNFLL